MDFFDFYNNTVLPLFHFGKAVLLMTFIIGFIVFIQKGEFWGDGRIGSVLDGIYTAILFVIVFSAAFGLAFVLAITTSTFFVFFIYNSILYILHFFSIIPFIPLFEISWIIKLLVLIIMAGLLFAYIKFMSVNNIIKAIGISLFFGCSIYAVHPYFNDFKELYLDKDKHLYVVMLNRFKINYLEYDQDNKKFNELIEKEIKDPSLNSFVIREIDLFNRYKDSENSSGNVKYSLNKFNKKHFIEKYSQIENKEMKNDLEKIISDNSITYVEKTLFEKKWKK